MYAIVILQQFDWINNHEPIKVLQFHGKILCQNFLLRLEIATIGSKCASKGTD